ncbi:MAG: BspA family leucine-rich repeat surface protein [Reichenbachiella sp.]
MKCIAYILSFSIVLFLFSFQAFSQGEFITTWQTSTNGETINLPTEGVGYDFDVDWGDESVDSDQTGDVSHTYASAGVYTVKITRDFPRIFFNNEGDRDKILTVEQWGDINWSSMTGAFHGCSNLNVVAVDAPDLNGVVSMFQMFKGALSFDGEIDSWDVSDVTTMYEMFSGATAFDQSLNSWNVRKVTDMTGMFNDATNFNQPLDEWETIALLNFKLMFKNAISFNQNINSWVVSQVKDMAGVFEGAESFNQPLDQWSPSEATTMGLMFFGASSFNQPINTWSVSKVLNFNYMFMNASDFDQSLSNWDIGVATSMIDMLSSTNMSVGNYDQTLIGWSVRSVTSSISFRAIGRSYCSSVSARSDLGWTFESDNQNCFQVITFDELSSRNVGDIDFGLTASSNTGLSITYSSSNEEVATVLSDVVSIVGAGSVIITASQAGDDDYDAAVSVEQELIVDKGSQLITFDELSSAQYGGVDFELIASSDSELAVSYVSSDISVATVSGSTVTLVGAGSTMITASQVGDDNYDAALSVDQELVVIKGDQIISFSELSEKTYGDDIFKLDGSVDSGLKISYASSNTDVASVDGEFIVVVGVGSTIITASQSGNDDFESAAEVQQLLVVNKAVQTIDFSALDDKSVLDDDFLLTAESSAALLISYDSSDPTVATVTDGLVEIIGAGSTIITASQKGDGNYLEAEDVKQNLNVSMVLGANGNKEVIVIELFPNPIVKELFVSIDEVGLGCILTVFNQKGQIELEMNEVKGDVHLDVSQLSSGVYFLQITKSNSSEVVRFLKR